MAIQPTGDQNNQPRRRNPDVDGKIDAFLQGNPLPGAKDKPTAKAGDQTLSQPPLNQPLKDGFEYTDPSSGDCVTLSNAGKTDLSQRSGGMPEKPNAWRSFVKNSSRVMNGASAIYSMARVFIGPGAMPPTTPDVSFRAPHNPMDLPEKLPRPYRQGKPKGQKYADEVDPNVSKEPLGISGDPPPGRMVSKVLIWWLMRPSVISGWLISVIARTVWAAQSRQARRNAHRVHGSDRRSNEKRRPIRPPF